MSRRVEVDRKEKDSRGSGSNKKRNESSGTGRAERIDYDEKESMEITTNDDVEVFASFDTMGLKEDLLRGIYAYGD